MFGNLGFSEMLVILAVALIVFGPQRLPEIARSLGRALGHFRRTANDLRNTVEREVRSSELGGALDDARSLARLADPRATVASTSAVAAGPALDTQPLSPDHHETETSDPDDVAAVQSAPEATRAAGASQEIVTDAPQA